MAEEKLQPAVNALNGRDPTTGKFTAGNACARGRRRVRVDAPIPAHLAGHDGVAVLWPLLGGLAAQGNGQALKLLADLALGLSKPARVGPVYDDAEAGFEEEDGEELEADFEDKVSGSLEGMSPAQRNALRRALRRAPEYDEDGPYQPVAEV